MKSIIEIPLIDNIVDNSVNIVLRNNSLENIGSITNVTGLTYHGSYAGADEVSFTVHKLVDNKECLNWDLIQNFKVIWIEETDKNYKIEVSSKSDNDEVKIINAFELCEYELSKIKLYDIEINTESDIEREEYKIPTTLFNTFDEKSSLMHRITEKAPHYSFGHVDEHLTKIQRTFSFDNISIYEAFQQISNEIGILFKFDSNKRIIEIYDLMNYCTECKERFENNSDVCPKCNSKNIIFGDGNDTTILVSKDNFAKLLSLDYQRDTYKNCLRIKTGDEILDATIKSLNPNGSNYIYYFNEETLNDMPDELKDKINSYNILKDDYINNFKLEFQDVGLKTKYNAIVDKYNSDKFKKYIFNEEGEKVLVNNDYLKIDESKAGYSNVINLLYDNIDFSLYIEHELMPMVLQEEVTIEVDIKNLNVSNLSNFAMSELTQYTSASTVESFLKKYAPIYLNNSYKLTLNTQSYDYVGETSDNWHEGEWIGTITIQEYGTEGKSLTTPLLSLKVTDNYELFLDQKIKKTLNDTDDEIGGIKNIFLIELDEDFKEQLTFYSSARLTSFQNAYQSALDVMIELDQASSEADFYKEIYEPLLLRKGYIDLELAHRNNEKDSIQLVGDKINDIINTIQVKLNFEDYIGIDLWNIFSSYRNEDTYSNSNVTSEGLDNKNLINLANEVMIKAEQEMYKIGTLQKTITVEMANMMLMKEFQQLHSSFVLGNFIRSEFYQDIYKVRFIGYELSLDEPSQISVELSSVINETNALSDTAEIVNKMKSFATSIGDIKTTVEKSKDTNNTMIDWLDNGLDLTNQKIMNNKNQSVIYDGNGLLIRTLDDVTGTYEDTQMKLVSSTIAVTDDNWKSVKTAIGKFYYNDPLTNERKISYGINAQVLIGNLLIGKGLIIKTDDSSFIIGDDGLIINSNSKSGYKTMFRIQKDGIDQMWIDNNGKINSKNLVIKDGDIVGGTVKSNNYVKNSAGMLIDLANGNIDSKNFKLNSGNITLTDGLIRSRNYVAGSAGTKIDLSNGTIDTRNFKLDTAGNVTANSGTFKGKIVASSGNIGDLTISSTGFSYSGRRNVKFGLDSGQVGLVDLTVSMRVPDELDGNVLSVNAHPVSFVTDDLYAEIGVGGIDLGFTGHVFSGWGNITNLESYEIHCDNLNVRGTKKRIIKTKNYATRSQYCYEMSSPFFGDIGEGRTDNEGLCYIYIDDIFNETISDLNYYVFLQSHSNENVYINEKHSQYFVVKGSPNTSFEWELKARQKNFDQERLEVYDKDKLTDIHYEENASRELLKYIRGGDLQ